MSIPHYLLYLLNSEFSCTTESEQTRKMKGSLFGFDLQFVNSQRTQNTYLYTEALLIELQSYPCVSRLGDCVFHRPIHPATRSLPSRDAYEAFSTPLQPGDACSDKGKSETLSPSKQSQVCVEVTIGLCKSFWIYLLALSSSGYVTLGRPSGPFRPFLIYEK